MVAFRLLVGLTALAAAGCGPPFFYPEAVPLDCAALQADQPDCMPDAAVQECEDNNASCACRGCTPTLGEGCPLEFGCAVAD